MLFLDLCCASPRLRSSLLSAPALPPHRVSSAATSSCRATLACKSLPAKSPPRAAAPARPFCSFTERVFRDWPLSICRFPALPRPWDRSIPVEGKSSWRDPAVAQAYVDAALASDPTSGSRQGPSFRSPCGALEDSFYLATGRQLWDASLITVPALIFVSERDFWSRPEDRQNLVADLVYSPKVQVVVLPGATHFVHLDREEHGRKILLDELTSFLAKT